MIFSICIFVLVSFVSAKVDGKNCTPISCSCGGVDNCGNRNCTASACAGSEFCDTSSNNKNKPADGTCKPCPSCTGLIGSSCAATPTGCPTCACSEGFCAHSSNGSGKKGKGKGSGHGNGNSDKCTACPCTGAGATGDFCGALTADQTDNCPVCNKNCQVGFFCHKTSNGKGKGAGSGNVQRCAACPAPGDGTTGAACGALDAACTENAACASGQCHKEGNSGKSVCK